MQVRVPLGAEYPAFQVVPACLQDRGGQQFDGVRVPLGEQLTHAVFHGGQRAGPAVTEVNGGAVIVLPAWPVQAVPGLGACPQRESLLVVGQARHVAQGEFCVGQGVFVLFGADRQAPGEHGMPTGRRGGPLRVHQRDAFQVRLQRDIHVQAQVEPRRLKIVRVDGRQCLEPAQQLREALTRPGAAKRCPDGAAGGRPLRRLDQGRDGVVQGVVTLRGTGRHARMLGHHTALSGESGVPGRRTAAPAHARHPCPVRVHPGCGMAVPVSSPGARSVLA